MVDEVLDPGIVGVVRWRHAVFPAHVLLEALATPIGHIEGRVGEDIVSLQILVQIVVEAVGLMGAEVGVDAADGQVHLGQLPGGGVGLLAVDGDVAQPAAVLLDELLALYKHPTGATAGVVHAALVGLDHLHQQLHHALRGVELAASLALGDGESPEEVFVDSAQRVPDSRFPGFQIDVAHQLDQLAKAGLVQGGPGVVLGQHALEAGVFPLDGGHGLVDHLADGGLGR